MTFPLPADEAQRLRALAELEILDTPQEALYDDIVQLAAAICGTPIAIVNLVDADRQWGKALVGLDTSEASRDASFCARTITKSGGELVIPDTLLDPEWATNAQVVGEPNIRFYAGIAIGYDGHDVGSLCVVDRRPRDLDPEKLDALRALARQTSALLALRVRTRQLEEANDRLARLAVEDPLTGLANRTLLYDRIEQVLRQRPVEGQQLGVLFVDLDGFKDVNDRLGHQAGDDILRIVAHRLAVTAREGDTVSRIAGDEFVVVCPAIHSQVDLDLIATRMAAAVQLPTPIAGELVTPRLSIGSALATPYDTAEDLVHRADSSMYRAKRSGSGIATGRGTAIS